MNNSDDSKLKQFFDETGMKPAEFARTVGESPQNVNNWIKKGIPTNKALKAAALLGVPLDRLVDTGIDKVVIVDATGTGKTRYSADLIENMIREHSAGTYIEQSKLEEDDLLTNFRKLTKSGKYAVMATLHKELEKLNHQ